MYSCSRHATDRRPTDSGEPKAAPTAFTLWSLEACKSEEFAGTKAPALSQAWQAMDDAAKVQWLRASRTASGAEHAPADAAAAAAAETNALDRAAPPEGAAPPAAKVRNSHAHSRHSLERDFRGEALP